MSSRVGTGNFIKFDSGQSKTDHSEESDERYLQRVEITHYLTNMFVVCTAIKPEDSIDFAWRYFDRVQSCHNVLGAEYSVISSCIRNKRNFVFCLMELFKTFNASEEMSVHEYQQIIEMICPDFPKTILTQVSTFLEVSDMCVESNSSNTGTQKYNHGELCIALYFFISYEDWIKYIEAIFKEEGSLDSLSMFRLKAYLEDCRNNWSLSFPQPPVEGVDGALRSISQSEVSFTIFQRALIKDPSIRQDACSTFTHAKPLIQEATKSSPTTKSAEQGVGVPSPRIKSTEVVLEDNKNDDNDEGSEGKNQDEKIKNNEESDSDNDDNDDDNDDSV
jgi:hypothetical protein